MECSTCHIPMYIKEGKHKVEGDTSTETKTRLFYVQTVECPKCKKTEIVTNEIPLEG